MELKNPNKFELDKDTINSNLYNCTVKDAKILIKRGCSNKECFCTGKCEEIIGWRDKYLNEF